jgi:DNA mismatch repair ATPase MutS
VTTQLTEGVASPVFQISRVTNNSGQLPGCTCQGAQHRRMDQVVLSLVVQNKAGGAELGAAILDPTDLSLNATSTRGASAAHLRWPLERLGEMCAGIGPTQVIISRSVPDDILSLVREVFPSVSMMLPSSCECKCMPESVRVKEPTPLAVDRLTAMERLLRTDTLEMRDAGSDRAAYLDGIIDLSNDVLVKALGGILAHQSTSSNQRKRLRDDDSVSFGSLREFSLDQIMQVDATTSEQLAILPRARQDASDHSQWSLFRVLNRTNTTLGATILRQWLLRPSCELHVITQRHDAIEELQWFQREYPHEAQIVTRELSTDVHDTAKVFRAIAAAAPLRNGLITVCQTVSGIQKVSRGAGRFVSW